MAYPYYSAPYPQAYDPRMRPGWGAWVAPDRAAIEQLDEPELLEQPVVDLFPDPDGGVPSFAPPQKTIEAAKSPLKSHHKQPAFGHDHLYWGSPAKPPAAAAHDPMMYNLAVDAWPPDIQSHWAEIQADPTVPTSFAPAPPAFTPAHMMGAAAKQSIAYEPPEMPFFAAPMPLGLPAPPMATGGMPPLMGAGGMPPLLPAPDAGFMPGMPGMDMAMVLAPPPLEPKPYYVNNINRPAMPRPPSAPPAMPSPAPPPAQQFTGFPPAKSPAKSAHGKSPGMHSAKPTPPTHGAKATPAMYGAKATPAMYSAQGMPAMYGAQGTPAMYSGQGMPAMYSGQGMPAMYGAQATPAAHSAKATPATKSAKATPASATTAMPMYGANPQQHPGPFFYAAAAGNDAAATKENQPQHTKKEPKHKSPADAGKPLKSALARIPFLDPVDQRMNMGQMWDALDELEPVGKAWPPEQRAKTPGGRKRGASFSAVPTRVAFEQPQAPYISSAMGRSHLTPTGQLEQMTRQVVDQRGPGKLDFVQPTPLGAHNFFETLGPLAPQATPPQPEPPAGNRFKGLFGIGGGKETKRKPAPSAEDEGPLFGGQQLAANSWYYAQAAPPPEKAQTKMHRKAASTAELRFLEQQQTAAQPPQRSASTKKGKKNAPLPPPPTQVGLNYAELSGAYAGAPKVKW